MDAYPKGKRPFLTHLFPRGSDAICSHRQILKVRTQDAAFWRKHHEAWQQSTFQSRAVFRGRKANLINRLLGWHWPLTVHKAVRARRILVAFKRQSWGGR